jgi:integrase
MKCTIENHDGRLRLRWLYQGRRYTMGCGVSDNPTGRAIAKLKSAEIEKDLINGYFDITLLKYKPRILGKSATEITAPELFERYSQAMKREKALSKNGHQKYKSLLSHLSRFFGDSLAQSISDRRAGDFTAHLLEHLAGQTAKQYLFLLRCCWDWAKGKYHVVESNPWAAHISRIKPSQSKRVKPFTTAEIVMILAAFKAHPQYRHYYPLVHFLFGTGCRFGEAAGLRWRNVADDFSHVVICEAISRGEKRDRTKTGKSRVVFLSPGVSAMLQSRHEQQHPNPNALVFPSPKGGAIDDHNFRNRAWKTIIDQLGIEYRKPYSTRHTAISHALASGANYLQVAEASGHHPRVMLQTYANVIEQKSVFVEF